MTEAERDTVQAVVGAPHIQALKKSPPDLGPSGRWAKTRRGARIVLQSIGVLAFALALYTNHEQGQVGDCVNKTLASRSAPLPGVRSDAEVHIDFDRALDKALTAPKAQQAARVREFKAEVQASIRDLSANQAARDAHPLGKC